jgi:tetratricopeptide (TPR) repeat protein
MKRCPQCLRDYHDESLSYCLDDGTALLEGPASSEAPTAVFQANRPEKSRSWLVAARPYLIIAVMASAGIAGFWFYAGRNQDAPETTAVSQNRDYLKAKVLIGNENLAEIDEAIKLLEKTVNDEPQFASGWAQLARAYNKKAFYFANSGEREELNVNAEVAVERSLAIDPNLAEGHFARGLLLWTHAKRFPHELAIQSYKRAISIDPNLDEAHHQLALVYLHLGLFDKARAEVNKTLEINPGNTLARFRYGVIDLYRGRYGDAAEFFKSTASKQSPALQAFQHATAVLNLGRVEEASKIIDDYLIKNPKDEGGVATSVKAMILARQGEAAQAEAAIRDAEANGRDFGHFHHTAYNIASTYATLRKPDLAVRYLQLAADEGFPCYPLFEGDEVFKEMRHFPEYVSLLARLKLQWERYNSTV